MGYGNNGGLERNILGIEWELPKDKEEKDKVDDGDEWE